MRSCWLGMGSRREITKVDFSKKRQQMAAVTMHFKKSQKHRKVHAGKLHLMQKVQCEKDRRLGIKDWIVLCRINLEIKKRRLVKATAMIKWWKLKKDKCCRW